eukprot:SAG25_NODE_167_length_13063_cov_9.799830_5_plen_70_part_00
MRNSLESLQAHITLHVPSPDTSARASYETAVAVQTGSCLPSTVSPEGDGDERRSSTSCCPAQDRRVRRS